MFLLFIISILNKKIRTFYYSFLPVFRFLEELSRLFCSCSRLHLFSRIVSCFFCSKSQGRIIQTVRQTAGNFLAKIFYIFFVFSTLYKREVQNIFARKFRRKCRFPPYTKPKRHYFVKKKKILHKAPNILKILHEYTHFSFDFQMYFKLTIPN